MSGEAPLRKQESSASLLHGDRSLVLGIDIGTTSVKVCIMDAATLKCVKQLNKDTQANVPSELGSEGNKQYVPKIISALHGCISRLPRDALRRVEKVGICGQMHGCVLWKSGRAWSRKPDTNTYDIDEVSHLYTWQDTRCTPEFLSSLPAPDSHLSVHSGYGVATLLWFLRHKPQKLQLYDRSGTIQDLVVAMLCDLDVPVMSVQNAASWGYFNTQTGTWNADILHGAGLPSTLLPSVVRSGQAAGRLHSAWLGLPAGTPVIAALGDLQCSVLPLLTSGSTAALNVSTSAQLALALPDGFHPPASADGCISYLPFLDGRYLAVAAALTGGNAMAAFVQMLQRWTQELGRNMPQSDVWTKILSLADTDDTAGGTGSGGNIINSGSGNVINAGSGSGSVVNASLASSGGGAELCIVPTVRGERHAPHQRATVTGVTVDNTGLGHVTNAICRGIAENLDSMMSREWLAAHGVTRLVGTGSALARNAALRRAFQRTYQVPLDMADETSAAYGAALAAARYL